MKSLRRVRIAHISALILLAAVMQTGAAERPAVTRLDARYLDRWVVFTVEWQSPNPVTFIRVHIGKNRKEVKIDEYDNRRNQAGYWGESTIEFRLDPEQNQDGVPYILQIEDELRRKSDQVTGKVLFPPLARKEADDSWGRTHLEKFANPPPLGAPQTSSTPSSNVDTTAGQPQVTAGSDPAGSHPTESIPTTEGKVFFIENILYEKLGDTVNVKVTVVDQTGTGVDSIIIVVFDANKNPIPDQPDTIKQVTVVDGKYEGNMNLQLPKGTYFMKGKALNRNGEPSPEKASDELRIGDP